MPALAGLRSPSPIRHALRYKTASMQWECSVPDSSDGGDEYLRDRYRQLGRQLDRLLNTMGLSRKELADQGPLPYQHIGHLLRGQKTNYEDATLGKAETAWHLPVGAIRRFLAGEIDHLERVDDPLQGLSDAELARLREMRRLVDEVDLPRVLAAAQVVLNGELAQARLLAAVARAQQDIKAIDDAKLPPGLGDAARTIVDVAQTLLDRAAG
jgi:hypothetical protein